MPGPAYIVCSESGSVDRYTNLVSCHNILERILVNPRREGDSLPPDELPFLRLRVVAAWRAQPGDEGSEFEVETLADLLGEDGSSHQAILVSGQFVFKTGIHRFIHTIATAPPPVQGTLQIVNRIRRVDGGDERREWLTQTYEIDVRHRVPEPEESATEVR